MGIFKELGSNILYGEEPDVPVQYKEPGRTKKPIEGQISWDFPPVETTNPKSLADLPKVRTNNSKLETRNNDLNNRPAYLKKDTMEMLMKRTEYTKNESDFLKTLVVFKRGSEIIFDKHDKSTRFLCSATIAHQVTPIDDWDVPFSCNWYQLISAFTDDDKKMEKEYVYYMKKGVDHLFLFHSKHYFYANPYNIVSSEVSLSTDSKKNGWEK